MSGSVMLAVDGWLATVTLSHEGRLNAMSRRMWGELREVFAGLSARPGIRCVVVAGRGGHFCAGGDISEYPSFRFDEESLRNFHETDVWGGLQAMLDCDVPLVAQLEGNCMGAGLEIASCCDIRIAAATARFGAPIARLGFPMAAREAALVSAATGLQAAREILLEAAVLDAPGMLARGFLNRVVPAAALAAEAAAAAGRICALSPQAARLNKKVLRRLHRAAMADAAAAADGYRYAASGEHREGVSAFLEKRQPVF